MEAARDRTKTEFEIGRLAQERTPLQPLVASSPGTVEVPTAVEISFYEDDLPPPVLDECPWSTPPPPTATSGGASAALRTSLTNRTPPRPQRRRTASFAADNAAPTRGKRLLPELSPPLLVPRFSSSPGLEYVEGGWRTENPTPRTRGGGAASTCHPHRPHLYARKRRVFGERGHQRSSGVLCGPPPPPPPPLAPVCVFPDLIACRTSIEGRRRRHRPTLSPINTNVAITASPTLSPSQSHRTTSALSLSHSKATTAGFPMHKPAIGGKQSKVCLSPLYLGHRPVLTPRMSAFPFDDRLSRLARDAARREFEQKDVIVTEEDDTTTAATTSVSSSATTSPVPFPTVPLPEPHAGSASSSPDPSTVKLPFAPSASLGVNFLATSRTAEYHCRHHRIGRRRTDASWRMVRSRSGPRVQRGCNLAPSSLGGEDVTHSFAAEGGTDEDATEMTRVAYPLMPQLSPVPFKVTPALGNDAKVDVFMF